MHVYPKFTSHITPAKTQTQKCVHACDSPSILNEPQSILPSSFFRSLLDSAHLTSLFVFELSSQHLAPSPNPTWASCSAAGEMAPLPLRRRLRPTGTLTRATGPRSGPRLTPSSPIVGWLADQRPWRRAETGAEPRAISRADPRADPGAIHGAPERTPEQPPERTP